MWQKVSPKSTRATEPQDLSEDAILEQRVGLHTPAPRAQVSNEARSVVISEPPGAAPRSSPAAWAPSRRDPTLVIRDRRELDEMRQKIAAEWQRHQKRQSRALYVWGGIGILAFAFGGFVAYLATASSDSAVVIGQPERAPQAAPISEPAAPPALPAEPAALPAEAQPRAVQLDELPVERRR
jgi:hypothetical protein